MKIKHYNKFDDIPVPAGADREKLKEVVNEFAFRTNSYYNSLINWDDPDDPLMRIIMPDSNELLAWGKLDASDERSYQPVAGIEHKYQDTALLLCNDVCAAYCRFCFRKRLFQDDNDEVAKDVSKGIAYIRQHPEINNVLMTGGDPLVISTSKLEPILRQLSEIEHVRIIRIGTKVPAFNPYRILDDPSLPEMIRKYSEVKQIYFMVHFNHPTELTDLTRKSLKIISDAGATVLNQTPIIRKVNDSPVVLRDLFNQLSFIGIQTYYVFACRPTLGNKMFAVPIEEAYDIYHKAKQMNSGLANTSRFIMSHKDGKIEIIGTTDDFIFFRHHRLVQHSLNGSMTIRRRNSDAYWWNDYDAFKVDLI